MRARRAVTLCIGVVPLLLGACGGDDDKDTSPQAKAFCAVADPVKKLSGMLESEDPAAIKAAFVAAESALNAVAGDPPKDIATDIATIKDTLHRCERRDEEGRLRLRPDLESSSSKAVSDLEDADVHQSRRQRAGVDDQELCVSVTAL